MKRHSQHTSIKGATWAALKVAGIYFLISILWIFSTDKLLEDLINNPHTITKIQTIKGWFFVTVSALVIFWLVWKEVSKKVRIIRTVNASRQWYNTMVSNLPKTVVFLLDKSLRFILIQGEEAAPLQLNPDELLGKEFREINLGHPARQILIGYLEQAAKGEQICSEVQYRNDWYELRASPVKQEDGDIIAIAAVLINITQQKENVRSLQDAIRKAEENEKLKTIFLENVSHELRTPLNAIIGFSELICTREYEPVKMEKFYSHIRESGSQLISMVDDLLHISEIEKGTISIENTEFSAEEMLDRLAEYYRLQFIRANKPVALRYIHSPESSSILFSEKTKLMQILSNLLNNAVKFTEKGFIEFGYSLESNKSVLFFVQDSGIGIESSDQSIIFERFRKGSTPNDQLYRGTGLGLSIARELVKVLEGEIWLFSKRNQGSCFMFRIPAQVIKTNWPLHKDPLTHGRAFIAEMPESKSAASVQDSLHKRGIDCLLVENEKELYSHLQENVPDFIMVSYPDDENMFTLFIQNLRKKYPVLPVIVFTEKDQQEIKDLCYMAGASEYCILPFTDEELDFLCRKYICMYRGAICEEL